MKHTIVTTNRLSDGAVVYLAAGGRWTGCLDDALAVAGEDALAALTAVAAAAVRERVVVAPYPIPVAVDDGRIRPLSQRERVRATGPTIRPDLNKQAAWLG
jgi:sulfite reductase (NADPH) hemoprotein beta-component